MRKRLLAAVLLLSMILTILPTAVMAVDTAPQVEDLSISGGANTVTKTDVNGSLVFTAPANSQVTDYTATVTLSDGAVLTPTSPQENKLYVDSVTETTATLKFHISIEPNVFLSSFSELDLNLTKNDDGTWTGGFSNASLLKLSMLSDYLENRDIELVSGALGTGSPAQRVIVNADDANMMLVLCAPDAVTYTVEYVVDANTTLSWTLPSGMAMPVPTLVLSDGASVSGWYTDAALNTQLPDDAVVTENTTLYAKTVGGSQTSQDFLTALEQHQDVTIRSNADWATFVANADKAVAGQLVTLGTNINCNNATYNPLEFRGNFDGGGYTISNAKFRSVLSAYYSSSEENIYCSGLFASIGPGQVIANLKLENITAQYSATYAGILAGLADGASNDRALIQNVQVIGGSASGRTAAGVVGFIRNTDVKFCSSRGTTISGLANGGGVVGINNAHVEYCFSTSTPTALTFMGGSAGGVISKSVRGGNSNYCWAYMDVVGANEDGAGQELNSLEASASMTYDQFKDAGFSQFYWASGEGMPADFRTTFVKYVF